jgi:hypothetical protein
VIETRGFARKNEDGRVTDRRLANRRLRPLGHLTADAKCTWNQDLPDPTFSFGPTTVLQTAAIVQFDWKIAKCAISDPSTMGTLAERGREPEAR